MASSRASCGRTLPCTFPEPGLFSRRVFNCFPRSTDRTTRSASLCVRLEDNDLQKLVRTFGDGQKNSYYGLDRDWETQLSLTSIDIACDLHDRDETGYVWAYLDEARNRYYVNRP